MYVNPMFLIYCFAPHFPFDSPKFVLEICEFHLYFKNKIIYIIFKN